jgi:hypothetical protein
VHREEGIGRLARRLVVAVTLALLLGGTTAVAIRYVSSPATPAARPSPTVSAQPDQPTQTTVADPSPSSPSPSASPSPSGSRTVAARPVAKPSSPSPVPTRRPLYYVPSDGLCAHMDFTALAALDTTGDKTPQVISSVKPGGNPPGAVCQGSLNRMTIRLAGVSTYTDPATAAARWTPADESDLAGFRHIPGLGDDAIGYYTTEPTTYSVSFRISNMTGFVTVRRFDPDAASFQAAVIATAKSMTVLLPTR